MWLVLRMLGLMSVVSGVCKIRYSCGLFERLVVVRDSHVILTSSEEQSWLLCWLPAVALMSAKW